MYMYVASYSGPFPGFCHAVSNHKVDGGRALSVNEAMFVCVYVSLIFRPQPQVWEWDKLV